MSRTTKESEDEIDMKIGRRIKAPGGTSVVDSPLRRSTRNKQPVNQDDGSSPESIASDVTGPPTRSTRRKTATMEYSTADNTRSLRPRKNSTASDTTDFADGEAPRDMKKRITRRSVAAIPSVETPTKVRLRRTTRAGSESNTASPSVRTTRRTRASSVDLEDNIDNLRDKSSLIHLHTPLKTRNRASQLPSEPSVIEESDSLQKEVLGDGIDNDSTNTNASGDHSLKSAKSPLLRLKYGDDTTANDEMDAEDTSVEEATTVSMKLCEDVLESSSDMFSNSFKLRSELREKLLSDIDLPKIVLHKADIPAQKSPRNKENEKSNIMMADKNVKSSNSNMVSQRKSANFSTVKNIQVKPRLNRSVDDNLVSNIDNQSMSGFTSSPNNFARSEQLESSFNNRLLANTHTVSASIGSKDESIIFLGETDGINEHKESMNDTVNDETIRIHHYSKDASLKNVSPDSLMNSSVMEIDTTVDDFVGDGTPKIDCNVSIDSTSKVPGPSDITKDDEKSYSGVANLSHHIVEKDVGKSSPLPSTDRSKDIPTTEYSINTSNASNSETFHAITSDNSVDNEIMQTESVGAATQGEDENETSARHDEDQSRLSERKSTPRRSQPKILLNELDDDDKTNDVSGSENNETDVETLFQDIPAEEWKTKHSEKSGTDESDHTEGVEHGAAKYENAAYAKEGSCKVTQKNRPLKTVETSDYDSDDTVIMQNTNAMLRPSETAHSTIVEEPMDVAGDGDDTEIDQEKKSFVEKPRRKSLHKSRQSLTELSTDNDDGNPKQQKHEGDASLLSKSDSSDKNDATIKKIKSKDPDDIRRSSFDTKSTGSASRKSLNIKSRDSDNDNKMRRRTIEKMNSSERRKSHTESISNETSQMDIDEDANVDGKKIEVSIKSPKDPKRKSLNESNREKKAIQNLIDEETNGNSMDSELESRVQHRKYSGVSKSRKNNSASVAINSTSDSESSDENNQSTIMPEFLFRVSTSEEDSNDDDSASIDSDVGRELNLNGDSISNYSDDNVAGDDCRASETENSNDDDDDDDDDDDMANFIVDDDEDEEDDSSEQNESENGESSIELLLKEDEIQESEPNESASESGNLSKTKTQLLESSMTCEEERMTKMNRSLDIMAKNTCNKNSPKSLLNAASMNSSTPKIQQRMSVSKVATSPRVSSGKMEMTNVNTSISSETGKQAILICESSNSIQTPTKTTDTPTDRCSAKKQIRSENSKLTRSKCLSDAPINNSMQVAPTESPEMKMLMKEKLNASLPTLQSKRRSLKASRRSSLMDVEEVSNERGEDREASMAERIEGSTDKMKKKKKMSADQLSEDLVIGESNAVSVIEDQNNGKNKKEKNLAHAEIDTLEAEQEGKPRKKKNSKQTVELSTRKTAVDKKKSQKELTQGTSKLGTRSLAITENEESSDTKAITKKSKKKNSKDERTKCEAKEPVKSSVIKENNIPQKKSNIKRISEDILENLSDIPARPKKRMKFDHKIMPSRTMFDSKNAPDNLSIDDVGYIPVSASGGTSQFSVVNLKKLATKHSKKAVAAIAFRERILGRNIRQPISAYLMYQQKLKASGKDKR